MGGFFSESLTAESLGLNFHGKGGYKENFHCLELFLDLFLGLEKMIATSLLSFFQPSSTSSSVLPSIIFPDSPSSFWLYTF